MEVKKPTETTTTTTKKSLGNSTTNVKVTPKKLERIPYIGPLMGADPEIFIKVGKKVVGSEMFISKDGERIAQNYGQRTKATIDGVQLEINTDAHSCRESLAGSLIQSFYELDRLIKVKNPKAELCFDRAVTISAKELEKLRPENQRFGCKPSFNVYEGDTNAGKIMTTDPLQYRKRAGGGHIHLGVNSSNEKLKNKFKENPQELVTILDYILGNLCVILDKSPANKERRKLYGRAGEYRLPSHGLEYRVLSNFWISSPELVSLVYGLSRVAIGMFVTEGYYEALQEAVPVKDIIKAINKNDYKLAYKNYKAIEDILFKALYETDGGTFFGLSGSTRKRFNYFIDTCLEKDVSHFLNLGDLKTLRNKDGRSGFSNFLYSVKGFKIT